MHLLGCLGFVRVVDEEVVSLTILADGVGERSQPPRFGSLDGRLGLFEVLLRLRGDALGLAGREVLAQDENSFVVGHMRFPVGGAGLARVLRFRRS